MGLEDIQMMEKRLRSREIMEADIPVLPYCAKTLLHCYNNISTRELENNKTASKKKILFGNTICNNTLKIE